jgi:hypothetical protein
MALIKELLKTSIFFNECNMLAPACMEKSNFADYCFGKWLAVVSCANDKKSRNVSKGRLNKDMTCR